MEKILSALKKHAETKELVLNPDEEKVTEIAKGLKANEEKRGARYCPCRVLTGDKGADADSICPCKWSKEELEKKGHCLCRLFFKT